MIDYGSYTDLELTDLFKSADHAAFNEIYHRYWNKLMAIAYNHTKDKSAAKEIVQELFVSLWNRKDSITIHSLNNYLATSIKFSVYKQIERERRRREIENSQYRQDLYAEDELNIEARFLQEYINGQVELLPDKCRLVFNYSRVKGMTIPEIAREMDISEKTVEGHLTKGLKTIRLSLKDSGIVSVIVCSTLHEWLK